MNLETSRSGNLYEEARRKLVHISGVLIIPLIDILGSGIVVAILMLSSIVLAIAGILHIEGKNIPILSYLYSKLERRGSFPGRGALAFALGISLSLFLFQEDIVKASILCLCLGDSAAAILGMLLGGPRLPYNKRKTLAGFLAFIIVSYLSTRPLLGFSALLASIVAAFIESLDQPIDDNAIIPITYCIVASLTPRI